jgi:hypothetical protein
MTTDVPIVGPAGPAPGAFAADVDGPTEPTWESVRPFAHWAGDVRHRLPIVAGLLTAPDLSGEIHRRYGDERGGIDLVRPDDYVAYREDRGHPSPLDRHPGRAPGTEIRGDGLPGERRRPRRT